MKKLLVFLSFLLLISITVRINAEVKEIPLEEIKNIAMRNAQKFCGDVYMDEPIPCYDRNDNIVTWQFNFSIGKPFPEKNTLYDRCRQEKDGLWGAEWVTEEYVRFIMGARTDQPVIIAYSNGLSYEYSHYPVMEKLANETFSGNFHVEKNVWVNYASRWFVVSDGISEKYISAYPPMKVLSKEDFFKETEGLETPVVQMDFTNDWDSFLTETRVIETNYQMISNVDLMPYYQWFRGCTPTACTMLLAWYDNNSAYSGRKYANFVKYHTAGTDDANRDYNYHVPDLHEDLHYYLDTNSSGSTQISDIDDGIDETIDARGYNGWVDTETIDLGILFDHDDFWDLLENEIDENKPPHLIIPGHSVTGVGYSTLGDNYVAIHDPNRSYTDSLSLSTFEGFTQVHLWGSYGISLDLFTPNGGTGWSSNGTGETWNCGNVYQIKWDTEILPYPTVYAKIWYSTLAGTGHPEIDWNLITDSTPNDGEYNWDIPFGINSSECRIRVEAYNNIDDGLWASDGSYGNFTITSGSPINNLSTGISEMMSEVPVEFFTFMQPEPAWAVIAARKGADNDKCGLTLYDSDDFNSPIVTSNYGSTINLIVIDRNHLPEDGLGVKAFITNGNNEGRIEYEGEDHQLIVGTNPVESFDGDDVAKMYDVTLTPGTYTINLNVLSGGANLDFGLYSSQEGIYYGPMGYGSGTPLLMNVGSANGNGEDEQIVVTIENTDVYGLCVWSNHYASATFQIDFDSPGEWIGTENISWDNANNWGSGIIPDRYDNVVIPAGTPYIPQITGGVSGEVKSLTIAEGASLMVGNGSLNVYSTANIYGTLLASDDLTEIEFRGHVRLYENSYFYDAGDADITVYGSWTAEDGAYVNLNDCTVFFSGAETMSLNIHSQTHEFNHVQVIKDTGYELIFGSSSTEELIINGSLYVAEDATLRVLNENPILVNSDVASYGKLEFEMGELVFEGSGTQHARFNSTDVLYEFSIESGCTVSMVTEMHLKGYLSIDGGTLNANGHNISTESGWSNNGGTFNPGGAIVIINGEGNSQYVNEDGFETLHLSKPGGGDLLISNGNSVTCTSFEWTSGNIRVNGGSFTANDLADIRVMGHYYLNGGTIDLHQGITSTEYVDLDADIWIYDGTFNIHGGYDYPSEWAYTKAITVYMEDGILDFKDNGIYISDTGHYINDAITGGIIRTSGDFKVDGNGFYPAGGSIELYGGETAYLHNNPGSSFHNVNINKGSSRQSGSSREYRSNQVIIDEDTIIDQDLIINNGFFQLSSATLTIGDDLLFYGGLYMDSFDEIIEIGNNVTWFNGSSATVSDGEFHVNGDWTFYDGIDCEFEADNTVCFDGSTPSEITIAEPVNAGFGSIILNKTLSNTIQNTLYSADLQISGDLTLNSTNSFSPYNVALSGDLLMNDNSEIIIGSGSFDVLFDVDCSGNIILEGGNLTTEGDFLIDVGGALTIDGGSCFLNKSYTGNFMSFAGELSIYNGSLQVTYEGIQFGSGSNTDMTGGILRVGSNFRANQANAFQPSGGAVEFIGTGSPTIECSNGNYFNNLYISKTGATSVCYAMTDLTVNNDLAIYDGTFNCFGHDILVIDNLLIGTDGVLNSDNRLLEVGGDWTNNRGSAGFVEGTGTVSFTGGNSYLMTDENFYNLEVNKTGDQFTYLILNDDVVVNVANDVNINSCSMSLSDNSTLNIDNDLIIAEYTNLRASIAAPTSINLSGDFMSHNISGYPWGFGFIPGLSTVTFNGSDNQVVDCEHIYQDFYNVIVNNTGTNPDYDCVILEDDVHVLGNFTVLDGTWKDSDVTTQEFYGNFEVNNGGWWVPLGHIKFKGPGDNTFEQNGGASFNSITINKEASRDRSSSLTLLSSIPFFSGFEGDLIIENGTFNLNGNLCSCSGDIIINTNGQLTVDDNALLRVGNEHSLTVNNGGILEVSGSSGNEARVSLYQLGHYHDVDIESGGTIIAEFGIFDYMTSNGVYVKDGAFVGDGSSGFNNCTFQNGVPGGSLLRIENNQDLVASNVDFPENTWGGTYNIYKNNSQGSVEFAGATGDFSGATYEHDPNGRIDWTGSPTIIVTPTTTINYHEVIIGELEMGSITIENTGEGTLNGTITTPDGYYVIEYLGRENTKDHSRNTLPYSVESDVTKIFIVYFTPLLEMVYEGDVVITHNAAGPDETVHVVGEGISPPPPEIYVDPTLLVFGDLLVGQNDTLVFYMENTGGSILSGSITTPDGFIVDEWYEYRNDSESSKSKVISTLHSRNVFPFELYESDYMEYQVVFTPTARQSYDGDIVITHNAGADEYIALEGNGIGAELTTNPASFEKSLPVDNTTSDILAIGNVGDLDLSYNASIDYQPFIRDILVSSGFENAVPPAGWTSQLINGFFSWGSDSNAHSGSFSAYANPMYVDDARLITPSFIATDDCSLNYWIRAYNPDLFFEMAEFQVEVLTDSLNWTVIDSYSQGILTDTYEQRILSLGAYAGQEIQVSFSVFYNFSGSGVNIDDVEITGTYPTYTWLTLDGGTSASGTILVGSPDDDITVGFDSSGLEDGTYNANIVFSSNDPVDPTFNVPVALTVGSTPLTAPDNLTIEVNATHVVLNWDAVSGATYKVYSSDDPNALTENWIMEEENIPGTTWNEPIPADNKFYRVTAVN